MENIRLNNGLNCPLIGIGTFMLTPVDAQNSVREALKMGYRLIDTANAYVNERAVGHRDITSDHQIRRKLAPHSAHGGQTATAFSASAGSPAGT